MATESSHGRLAAGGALPRAAPREPPGDADGVAGRTRSQSDRREPADLDTITLLDVALVLYKRRLIMAAVFALSLLGGIALTLFMTPQYEATATVLPLSEEDIIFSWLQSRQAAEYTLATVGPGLNEGLFPEQWDAAAGRWVGPAPPDDDVAALLQEKVSVTSGGYGSTRVLVLTVTLPDAVLVRDVASAYLGSLDALRPELENITRAELFDRYYDGSNSQEAQQRAETAANEKRYWITFDEPKIPSDPVSPRPVLNVAVAAIVGAVLAMGIAFALEWLGHFRVEFQRVLDPPRP